MSKVVNHIPEEQAKASLLEILPLFTREDVEGILKVVKEKRLISDLYWSREGNCGCIIGTPLHNHPELGIDLSDSREVKKKFHKKNTFRTIDLEDEDGEMDFTGVAPVEIYIYGLKLDYDPYNVATDLETWITGYLATL